MYDGIGNAMTAFAIIAFAAGAAVCGLLFWLVPWLWSLIKPWLHAIKA